MKTFISAIFVLTACGVVFAQNTQREPLQGGAANPTTASEAPATGIGLETGRPVTKKKPKTNVTPAPSEQDPKPSNTTTETP